MDIGYAPVMRVANVLSTVDRSRIYKEVLYRLIWSEHMLSWSNSMSSDGVVFLSRNMMVSMWMYVYYAPMVRDAYVLTMYHCSPIYKEVLYKVAWSERMLCGSTTMSSLVDVFLCQKMGWY